ncbi:MAG: DUF2538 family protein [Carnobacterium alterfunditum]
MYFINDSHVNNFKFFSSYYGELSSKPEYQANIYIASIPEIFKLVDTMALHGTENAPLITLMHYNNETNLFAPNKEKLADTFLPLVEIGMSLYNGHQCSLNFELPFVYEQVVLQAMELRYKPKFLQYN